MDFNAIEIITHLKYVGCIMCNNYGGDLMDKEFINQ